MAYTPRTRDRYRLLVSAVSGLTTVGVVAATGAVTGLAAEQTARRDAARAQAAGMPATPTRTANREPHRAVVWKRRPHRTVVSTRVIQQASSPSSWVGRPLGSPGRPPAAPHPGARRPTRGRRPRRRPRHRPSRRPPRRLRRADRDGRRHRPPGLLDGVGEVEHVRAPRRRGAPPAAPSGENHRVRAGRCRAGMQPVPLRLRPGTRQPLAGSVGACRSAAVPGRVSRPPRRASSPTAS